ncbi:TPA: hypothetical protein IUU06_002069 [Enterococcus faecalis]|uniref:hypothetical protein n=1 Tax=Enterococcus faecalis TaxID=1351 RepID=UPI000668FAFC|nr:hypothetical protein [Enterococcus faecalis]EGO5188125.1 hypothetical protein [Enterococcus faecalis]EGO5803041.1 hypothetical protein [Enterococcus faecalis]EGO5828137.1 hypothetical protein [Enterococcus faecalis]EGO6510961.1 hypothetical protein [Enterococcus faecalis]EHA4031867.1 hypothetical protein [Enterococcus faecalis]
MSKRPIYLPIELQDVFDLIEGEKVDSIYFQDDDDLRSVIDEKFDFEELTDLSFYVKQEYTPKTEQDVQL